ncbi:MAG TPA: PilC/PilY family type IV pilus protein, partial [Rubrivivax sp.]|nr:PilC/PilY family type IV pilus protein [Rubrivivax sp.]
VVPLNNNSSFSGPMLDADDKTASKNHYAAAGQFYLNAMTPKSTPTRGTIKYIGDQFNIKNADPTKDIVQYACQRNSMFVVTDGFANDGAPTVPSYNAATYGPAAPYQTTASGSMADQALAYFTNRLRTDLAAGRVPQGNPLRQNPDLNTNLHITTYGITLGARGTLFPAALDPFAVDVFATPPTWPTPVADDPTMIDDLWHATVNGRGKMYLASDVDRMRYSIQSAFSDIQDQEGAQGGIAVSAVNLDRGDSQAYLGSYNPAGWAGDLAANPIDKATGQVNMAVASQKWSAAALLAARAWGTRLVFSSSGSSGVDFSAANVGSAVNAAPASFSDAQVVDYLRGARSGEGSTFRTRTSLIGAVINAEPVLARDEKMVYLASGEGMLHAFDTVTGNEEWAYAPPDVLAGMGASAVRGWVFQTLLDATPVYGKLSGGSKMLIGGLGAAGRSYYALDVSSPKNLSATAAAAQFKWVFPAAGDATNRALMGYTVGKPVIVKTTPTTDRILVTSGYDNGQAIGDGKGRLWVLDTSGNVIKSFVTSASASAGDEAGLAHVSAFKEADGTVRYAYGGDLKGNLWRFDLQKAGSTDIAADLVAVLKDGSGNPQPVTAAPELTAVGGKRVILIGTGRLLDIGDFGSSKTQSFYAIADDAAAAPLTNARSSLVKQVYTRGGSPELSANTVNWATGRGFYFDLPAGEQANTDPIVTYGAVTFVTNKNGGADCSQQSYLYLVDIKSGTAVPGSTFVADTISTNATSSRVITLRVVNGKIVGTTHKSDNTVYQKTLPLGVNIDPSKNAWRELRR